MQRARPRMGALGLKAFELPDGRVERGSLGRLRFHFDGKAGDFEPENDDHGRAVSEEELGAWNGLQRMVTVMKPVTDPRWNLLSMRLGDRVLRRLPLGGVVTFVPDGTQPFRSSLDVTPPKPERRLGPRSESEILRAIDEFLREEERLRVADPDAAATWRPPPSTARQTSHVIWTTLGHGRGRPRGKWHKCPLCHTPVVRGPYNPRIPFGAIRPGSGAIKDLRGGYLSRLRETYLIGDPQTLLVSPGAPVEERAAARDPKEPPGLRS